MAKKSELRVQRSGTVINTVSKVMEKRADIALRMVCERLEEGFPGIRLAHEREWKLAQVVESLCGHFPDVEFHYYFNSSAMKPDGGILSIVGPENAHFPILITEVKNQGTNDLRQQEGMKKQAKGNAIERLGKNVIGFRTALLHESIFPFVCFGDGCDFAEDSSILDRVVTISMFGELNKVRVQNEGPSGLFNRGSFFFRHAQWSAEEMAAIMGDIAEKSIYHYFSRHGRSAFIS